MLELINALEPMPGFFTLGIGRLLGVESFTLLKLCAVLLSTSGVAIVALEDSSTNDAYTTLSSRHRSAVSIDDASPDSAHTNPLLGDFFALLSGLFYAVWVTYLKRQVGDESRIDMKLFLGFVGATTLTIYWPLGIILHYIKFEPFAWSHSYGVWKTLGLSVLVTLTSNYLYPLAMLKTTPLVVTIGISMTIPCAVVGDWAILGAVASWQTLFGATLVLVSFVGLGIEGAKVVGDDPPRHSDYEGIDQSGDDDLENAEEPNSSPGR